MTFNDITASSAEKKINYWHTASLPPTVSNFQDELIVIRLYVKTQFHETVLKFIYFLENARKLSFL